MTYVEFGGPKWQLFGELRTGADGRFSYNHAGAGRHLYVDGGGNILNNQPESPFIHLCHVRVFGDSMMGPVQLHRRDNQHAGSQPSETSKMIKNAGEYEIGEYLIELSNLMLGLGDEPTALISGEKPVILTSDGNRVYNNRLSNWEAPTKIVIGDRPYAVYSPKGVTNIFVASSSDYDGVVTWGFQC